ncbi:MAG: hypothetical protein CMC86_07930 [Flavobacteriaceae bacterium]|nr:hypothetical protein [Flavobacteriaceae bacterium]|tara:strand:- start:23958 stop:24860 length:903 start_codon:yes stop_codon:yes gene_type:complete
MKIIYGFSIVSSFFGLWITSLLPRSLELVLGFVLIFSFGMIHGSNDILIIKRLSNAPKDNFVKVLLTYLFVVSLAIIFFYFVPELALLFFVLFSSYHFGEQHWENKMNNLNERLKRVFFFSYGLLILYLIFCFNIESVIGIIYDITGFKIINIYTTEVISILIVILSLISSVAIYKKNIDIKSFLREIFLISVLSIIFKASSLIWGFTIYFIIWHSIPSLVDQISFIYGSFNKSNILKYTKDALPFWLVSILGIFILFLIFKDEKHFHSLFFAFIAAVTFPHAIVMLEMFSKKKRSYKIK